MTLNFNFLPLISYFLSRTLYFYLDFPLAQKTTLAYSALNE